jgi:hypothetical protein
MGKIVVSEHVSLDGVMQSPGPTDVPFKYRGWIMEFDTGPEGERFQIEQAQNAEALLVGRVTHKAMQAMWPTAEGEFADRLNDAEVRRLLNARGPVRGDDRPGRRLGRGRQASAGAQRRDSSSTAAAA